VGLSTAAATAGVSAARGPDAFVVAAKALTPINTATSTAGPPIKVAGHPTRSPSPPESGQIP
jgi:hypothetical protein